MATNFLASSSSPIGGSIGSYLNPLVGGTGAMGSAAGQTWQAGQFMPYNLSLPGNNINFSNNGASANLTGGLGSMYTGAGALGSNLLSSGALNYNPQAGGYLQGQYNNIYGTNPSSAASINGAANTQFQNLMQAEQPWLQMQRAQNLDSEMAKGTLASTAGSYQTAGVDQAQNSLMSQNANTAFQQALQGAGLQQSEQAASMNAASNVAGLQEQESQFAPQLATGQVNSAFGNLNNTNSQIAQQIGLGANIGGIQSNANTNALQNNFTASQQGLQSQSGFLNNLLFGGGSGGGLLNGLLGLSGQGGSNGALGQIGGMAAGGIGKVFNALFGGGGSSGGPSLNYNLTGPGTGYLNNGNVDYTGGFNNGLGNLDLNMFGDYNTPTSDNFNNMNSGFDSSGLGGGFDNFTNFNGAGGQAANQTSTNTPSNLGGDIQDVGGIYQGLSSGTPTGDVAAALDLGKLGVNNGAFGNNTASAANALGYLGNGLGAYTGLAQGGVLGDTAAASNIGQAAARAGMFGSSSGAIGGALGKVAPLLGLYTGLKQGGAAGDTEALMSGYQLASSLGYAPSLSSLASEAASSVGSGAGGAGLGALGAAAIPAAFLAAAAFAPSSEEFTHKTINDMENNVTKNTSSPGQLSSNAPFQAVNDLMSLAYENPEEYAQSGGTGPITQYLQSMGYNPVDWSTIKGAKLQPARVGKQL